MPGKKLVMKHRTAGGRSKRLGLLKDLMKVDVVLKQMLGFMIHEAICNHHRLLKG